MIFDHWLSVLASASLDGTPKRKQEENRPKGRRMACNLLLVPMAGPDDLPIIWGHWE